MKIIIEFPLHILIKYHGASNLDETLDNHITPLIEKYYQEQNIGLDFLSLSCVPAVPNKWDELFRYEIKIHQEMDAFKPAYILKELKKEGFDEGLTIRSEDYQILYADASSPDIQFRRKLKKEKKASK